MAWNQPMLRLGKQYAYAASVAKPTSVYGDHVRYLLAVIASASRPADAAPGEMAAIDAFNDRLEAAGKRIIALGIAAPSSATVFDNRNGAGITTPGPVSNVDDFMAGFWVIDAESDEEARILAAEASQACNRRIELRPVLG